LVFQRAATADAEHRLQVAATADRLCDRCVIFDERIYVHVYEVCMTWQLR